MKGLPLGSFVHVYFSRGKLVLMFSNRQQINSPLVRSDNKLNVIFRMTMPRVVVKWNFSRQGIV